MKRALWFLLSASLAAGFVNDFVLKDPARTAVDLTAAVVMVLSGVALYLTRSAKKR
ncbi:MULTISPECIES: hypothetical protein [Streptomyces]|uniref:hypothetical protein n=1 Tax=Streptomyces TaxID=1883 RepID=UPI0002F8412E|nr:MULTISPECIES: hypothetical protein [Streptomyces]MYS63660.1 hypothetical protein [Streptomyces sp. SID5473]